MSDLYVMQATLVSADYVSFRNHTTFKGVADWADEHLADVSMQLSEYVTGSKAYIVRLTDAQLSDAEWEAAFENGYVNIAGIKFYLTEGRRVRVGTGML